MKIVLLFSLLLVLVAFPAMAEEPVAVLKTVQGGIELARGGQTLHPEAGDPLQEGDVLKTGQDSAAGITFIDGTRLSLGPSSELRVDDYRFSPAEKDYAFEVFMNKGSAVYTSGKMGKMAPAAVRFSTPNSTLGIRGTRFLVQVK
jgi:hypothetical protein